MMSVEDKSLLDRTGTYLVQGYDLEGSNFVDPLRQRRALFPQQVEVIKVNVMADAKVP